MVIEAKLLIQRNRETDETHIAFLTDPKASVEDAMVNGGSWARADLTVKPVTIECDSETARILGEREFRTEVVVLGPSSQRPLDLGEDPQYSE